MEQINQYQITAQRDYSLEKADEREKRWTSHTSAGQPLIAVEANRELSKTGQRTAEWSSFTLTDAPITRKPKQVALAFTHPAGHPTPKREKE